MSASSRPQGPGRHRSVLRETMRDRDQIQAQPDPHPIPHLPSAQIAREPNARPADMRDVALAYLALAATMPCREPR